MPMTVVYLICYKFIVYCYWMFIFTIFYYINIDVDHKQFVYEYKLTIEQINIYIYIHPIFEILSTKKSTTLFQNVTPEDWESAKS